MDSEDLLTKFGPRLRDAQTPEELRSEIFRILLNEGTQPDEAESQSWRLAEELWRSK